MTTIKTALSILALSVLSACSLQGGEGGADELPPVEDSAVPTDDAGNDAGPEVDANVTPDAGNDASVVVPTETCKPAVFKTCGTRCIAAHKAYISDSPTATFRFFDGSNATCASVEPADAEGYIKCHLAPSSNPGQLRFTYLDTKPVPAWAQYGGLDSDLPEMCDASMVYCNWYNAATGTTFTTGDDKCDGYYVLGADGSLTKNGNAGALDANPDTK